MKIFHFEIPVPSYDGYEVFNQTILFDGTKPFPSKEQLIDLLKELDERDAEYPEYTGSWKHCIHSVLAAEDFPVLHGNLMATNTFTTVVLIDMTVRAPFSVQCRDVY